MRVLCLCKVNASTTRNKDASPTDSPPRHLPQHKTHNSNSQHLKSAQESHPRIVASINPEENECMCVCLVIWLLDSLCLLLPADGNFQKQWGKTNVVENREIFQRVSALPIYVGLQNKIASEKLDQLDVKYDTPRHPSSDLKNNQLQQATQQFHTRTQASPLGRQRSRQHKTYHTEPRKYALRGIL